MNDQPKPAEIAADDRGRPLIGIKVLDLTIAVAGRCVRSASGKQSAMRSRRTWAPARKAECLVYAKRPFGGPEAVLAYLSRYTHRVAISNSRLIALDGKGVTFQWKDYRAKGRERAKVITLASRFIIHVLPHGFHRIRHYGLFASAGRAENIV
jgi:hypothetical protein